MQILSIFACWFHSCKWNSNINVKYVSYATACIYGNYPLNFVGSFAKYWNDLWEVCLYHFWVNNFGKMPVNEFLNSNAYKLKVWGWKWSTIIYM